MAAAARRSSRPLVFTRTIIPVGSSARIADNTALKLLATLLLRDRRLVPSAERGLSVALLGFLAAIEFAGYHATTEFHAVLAGTALVAVAMFVAAYHRSRPLGWVEALQDRAIRGFERFSQLKYDVGID